MTGVPGRWLTRKCHSIRPNTAIHNNAQPHKFLLPMVDAASLCGILPGMVASSSAALFVLFAPASVTAVNSPGGGGGVVPFCRPFMNCKITVTNRLSWKFKGKYDIKVDFWLIKSAVGPNLSSCNSTDLHQVA